MCSTAALGLRTKVLLGILASVAGLGGVSWIQQTALEAETTPLITKHVGENSTPGVEVASEVIVTRDALLFGTPRAKVEIFVREKNSGEEARITGIEYNYVLEDGKWRYVDSGGCSDTECIVRGNRAFGRASQKAASVSESSPERSTSLRRNFETLMSQQLARSLNGFELTNTSVPFEEILRGGPPRDGIPAILDPKFVAASEVNFLLDTDLVVGLKIGETARAYPLRILVWHEIVNDTLDEQPVIVTYCPLCGTAMVFSRQISSRDLTFGVSGLLHNSDVLMYDHQTESLWSQLKMEAISGEFIGEKLQWISSAQMTWAAWRSRHPDTAVLSTETGLQRDYSKEAYAGYEARDSTMFPVPEFRNELKRKEWVVGVVIDGVAKAYPVVSLQHMASETIADRVGTMNIELHHDAEANYVRITDASSGAEVPSVRAYWFAWQAFYPETLIFDYATPIDE